MAKSKDVGNKTLKDTLADIDSHFGKGTVMRMGDREIFFLPRQARCSLFPFGQQKRSRFVASPLPQHPPG